MNPCTPIPPALLSAIPVPESTAQARSHGAQGRSAVAAQPAFRLPLSPALPVGAGNLQPAGARLRGEASRPLGRHVTWSMRWAKERLPISGRRYLIAAAPAGHASLKRRSIRLSPVSFKGITAIRYYDQMIIRKDRAMSRKMLSLRGAAGAVGRSSGRLCAARSVCSCRCPAQPTCCGRCRRRTLQPPRVPIRS